MILATPAQVVFEPVITMVGWAYMKTETVLLAVQFPLFPNTV
jgi:hypothetical protein